MTALQLYEAVLVELNKVKAPSMSLNDFIYFVNKSVQQYANYKYNVYEMNQQLVDDLRPLRTSCRVDLGVMHQDRDFALVYINANWVSSALYNGTYLSYLPDDYWHILNCVVEFLVNKEKIHCKGDPDHYVVGARRLTADAAAQVINNYYFKPTRKNPYYLINGTPNTGKEISSPYTELGISTTYPIYKLEPESGNLSLYFYNLQNSPVSIDYNSAVDLYRKLLKEKNKGGSNIASTNYAEKLDIKFEDDKYLYLSSPILRKVEVDGVAIKKSGETIDSTRERSSYMRYGNPTKQKILVYCGDEEGYLPVVAFIDYLRAPLYISLTQEQIDDKEDNSLLLEFPDYVCYEIVNWIVKLVMENTSNPRMPNTVASNLSIVEPGASAK